MAQQAKTDSTKKREDEQKRQQRITQQWNTFASGPGKEAIEDLFGYIEDQREMYRKYAEERAMPHPDPNKNELVPINNETIAALLQNSRGTNIVKTYISNRIDTDVVPTK